MINEIEQTQIDRIQYEEDLEKIIGIAGASSNPYFLQQYAINYNWDDGFTLPIAIANNRYCDLGTALTLFWLAEGMGYFTGEIEVNEYNSEWAAFCELLTKRILKNSFQKGPVSYRPNINNITSYKYKKAEIPEVLYQEVVGASI